MTREERLTENSLFLRLTIEKWLDGMEREDRIRMVNTLYDLLTSGDVEVTDDILQPKSLINYLGRLRTNEQLRKYLASDLTSLLKAAKAARAQLHEGEI